MTQKSPLIHLLAMFAGAFMISLIFPTQSFAQPEVLQDLRLTPGDAEHAALKAGRAPLKAPTSTRCILSTSDFVVTGSSSSSGVSEHCFPNAGGNIFAPRFDITGLSIVDGMDVADLDNDGDNDFLACDGLTGEVYLYTQGPADVFVPTTVATGVTPGGGSFLCTYLRVADFNNDNLMDFVVGDHLVTGGTFVYEQGPPGTFTPQGTGLDVSWATATGGPCNCLFGVATGDVNVDGNADILLLGFTGIGAGQVWYYEGDGNSGMSLPTQIIDVTADFPGVINPTGLALFDLEGDGDPDVIVGGSFDGNHYIYTNDGMANFFDPPIWAFNTNNYSGIDAYDADGDQDHDLMLVDWTSQRLLFSENQNGVMAAPVAVGVVDAPSLGVGAPELPEKPFELDHFKCYGAQAEQPVDSKVQLTDQFDSGSAIVIEPERFCNPVTKFHDEVVTSIMNEDAHLEFITIEAEGETPSLVEVDNQFGDNQRLEIGRAAYLAVPTQKIEPNNHPFPKNLDHFKCYEVQGDNEPVNVALRDQFGFEEDLLAITPLLLCNPAKKEHDGVTTPIENPADHLVCYELDNTKQIFDFAFINNQFGKRGLQLDRADMLCLPSRKTVID